LKQKRDRIGVIFMSGYTETAVLENATVGSDAILLNKPFSTELLARKISELQEKAGSRAMAASSSG
jgi:two-component SAPR family response regulator